MNILNERTVKGKRRLVVELEDNEVLTTFVPEAYYRMGNPHDDIVQGNHICNAERVDWCVVEQAWRPA